MVFLTPQLFFFFCVSYLYPHAITDSANNLKSDTSQILPSTMAIAFITRSKWLFWPLRHWHCPVVNPATALTFNLHCCKLVFLPCNRYDFQFTQLQTCFPSCFCWLIVICWPQVGIPAHSRIIQCIYSGDISLYTLCVQCYTNMTMPFRQIWVVGTCLSLSAVIFSCYAFPPPASDIFYAKLAASNLIHGEHGFESS